MNLTKNFERGLRDLGGYGAIIGGGSLLAIMTLLTLNVIGRVFRMPITEAIEMSELILMAGSGFALAYAALTEANIEITVLTRRLPEHTKRILHVFAGGFSTLFWTVILWQDVALILHRGLRERTNVLEIIYLPFRCIWLLGLIFMCLIFMINTINSLKKESNK